MKVSAKRTFITCDQFHHRANKVRSFEETSTCFIAKIEPSKKDFNKTLGFFNSAKNFHRIVWSVFILFVVSFVEVNIAVGFGALAKPITPAEHKYEEYYIEHEISSTQAKNSVMAYNSNSLRPPPPGCQKCTEEEFQYCGSSLVNDHCCCDKEYFEKLPFIPHTCYLGAQPCTPIQDCATYARLRDCCCNNPLIKKWMAKNSATLPGAITSLQLLMIIMFTYIF